MIEAKVCVGKVMQMPKTCHMTSEKLKQEGYDSVRFNPGDGDEYVVYSPAQVISTRQYPWP